MNKKIILGAFAILLFCPEGKSQSGQNYYLNSVFEGFTLGIGYMGDNWKADVVSPKANSSSGFQLIAKYGLTEKIGLYGRYQYIKTSGPNDVELFFLEHTNEVIHRPVELGASLHFGSTNSHWRYNARLGLLKMSTEQGLFNEKSVTEYSFDLTGLGLNIGGGIHYFITSFISASVHLDLAKGKYKRSNLLGLTHKEKLKFRSFKGSIGLNYHFSGR